MAERKDKYGSTTRKSKQPFPGKVSAKGNLRKNLYKKGPLGGRLKTMRKVLKTLTKDKE